MSRLARSVPDLPFRASAGVARRPAIAALALAAACGGGDKPTVPDGPGALATLAIAQATLDTLSELSSRQLTITGADSKGRAVVGITASWRSTDTTVVGVTSGGVVIARQPGTATITAESGKVSSSLRMRVVPVPVRDITVRLLGAVSADTMLVGTSAGVVAEAHDVTGAVLLGRTVDVRVADSARGAIDVNGRVIGRTEGALELVVTADTVVRRRSVIVRPPFAAALAVRLADPKQLRDTMWIGLRDSAIATFADASGKALAATPLRPVAYSSSDLKIATVDAQGRVLPVAAGTVTIRATGDGLAAARAAVVVAAPLANVLSASDTVRLAPGDSALLRPVLVDGAGLSVRSITGHTLGFTAVDAGRATVSPQGWVRGVAPGVAQVRVTVDKINTVVPVKVAEREADRAFQIDVRFVGPVPSEAVQAAFAAAKAQWQNVIRETIGSVIDTIPLGACGSTDSTHVETVRDVIIFARIDSIDGPSNILGQAGPCGIRQLRSGKWVPEVGRMAFDSADMATMTTRGILTAVITHEMGHVLGIGTLWAASANAGVALARQSGTDPRFFGSGASFASAGLGRTFSALGTNGAAALEPVPLENTGGSGTAYSHWRESVYENELMTGFVNNGSNPLSLLTVQAMADMGYATATSAAETYGVIFSTPAISYSSIFGSDPGFRIPEQLTAPEFVSDGRHRLRPIRPGTTQPRQ